MDTNDAPAHQPASDQPTVRFVAVDESGTTVDLAELVRAVYDGAVDPDDYVVHVKEQS